MPDKDPPPDGPQRGEKAFLRALALILLGIALLIAWPLRTAIVFALFVGVLLQGMHRRLTRLVRKPMISALLLLVVVALVLIAPLGVFVFFLVQEARAIATTLQDAGGPRMFLADALQRLGVPSDYARSTADGVITKITAAIGDFLVPALNAVTELTVGLIVFFILTYFFLVDGPRMVTFVRRVLPLRQTRKDHLVNQTRDRVFAIIYGSFLVSLIQGVVAGVGWWLLGMPNPIFWGFVMLVLSLVPVIGAFVVLLPGAIYAFTQGMLVAGFGLLALNFIAVGLIDDVLRPYLIGRRSKVHTGIILVGMIGGILVFGVGGLLIGPLLMAAVAPVLEAWRTPGEGALDDADAAS